MNTSENFREILCYGDSNTWGWVPNSNGAKRYQPKKRWTGVLQNALIQDFEIIEEGLGGRTVASNDPRPEFPERNGLQSLKGILETHIPLDLFIVMLGTTDLKAMLNKTAKDISNDMNNLIKFVLNFRAVNGKKINKILLIAPPIIIDSTSFTSKLFKGGTKKSKELINEYKKIAIKNNIFYLNPNNDIKVNLEEGIHLDDKNHKILGKIVAGFIKQNL